MVSCNISTCVFLTDNLHLSKAVSQFQPPLGSDWRAFEEIMQSWKMMKEHAAFVCRHINREENEVADWLAKMGSKEVVTWNCSRFTYPFSPCFFCPKLKLTDKHMKCAMSMRFGKFSNITLVFCVITLLEAKATWRTI